MKKTSPKKPWISRKKPPATPLFEVILQVFGFCWRHMQFLTPLPQCDAFPEQRWNTSRKEMGDPGIHVQVSKKKTEIRNLEKEHQNLKGFHDSYAIFLETFRTCKRICFFSVGDVEIWSHYDTTNLVFSRALAAKRCIYSDTTLHSEYMFSMPNLVKNSEVSKLYGVWHDLECTVPPTEATMIQTHQKNTAKSITSSNKQLLIHPSYWVVSGMICVFAPWFAKT